VVHVRVRPDTGSPFHRSVERPRSVRLRPCRLAPLLGENRIAFDPLRPPCLRVLSCSVRDDDRARRSICGHRTPGTGHTTHTLRRRRHRIRYAGDGVPPGTVSIGVRNDDRRDHVLLLQAVRTRLCERTTPGSRETRRGHAADPTVRRTTTVSIVVSASDRDTRRITWYCCYLLTGIKKLKIQSNRVRNNACCCWR